MKLFLTLTLLILFRFSFSQNQTSNWFFGDHAGISFSSGSVSPNLSGQLSSLTSAASISDSLGNLLFYTDGLTVWSGQHLVMQNGLGLTGYSNENQIMIIPVVGASNLYYIFYVDSSLGLRYSVVDMNLNSGLGGVTDKNILLHNNASGKMSGVLHCNKQGVWLMTINFSTDQFYAYLITLEGICPPVKSLCGNIQSVGFSTLKFSPNGEWLVYCEDFDDHSGTESKLYRFNDNTGIATFHSNLPREVNSAETHFGISFSPNSSRLYIGTIYYWALEGAQNRLYQYDMESANIPLSKQLIYWEEFEGTGVVRTPFGALQNGPDGRIYLARSAVNSEEMDTLGVINKPNTLGIGCNFIVDQVPLNGRNCGYSLPNFLESYFNTLSEPNAVCQCVACGGYSAIYASECSEYVSPSGYYVWTNSGTYYDTIPGVNGCDSILQVNLTITQSSNSIIQQNETLISFLSADAYQWIKCPEMIPISNAINPTYQVIENGEYALVVNKNGCIDTSDCYVFDNLGLNELNSFKVSVYPNPSEGIFLVKFEDKAQSIKLSVTNLQGEQVYSNLIKDCSEFTLKLDGSPGVYLLDLMTDNAKKTFRLLKN